MTTATASRPAFTSVLATVLLWTPVAVVWGASIASLLLALGIGTAVDAEAPESKNTALAVSLGLLPIAIAYAVAAGIVPALVVGAPVYAWWSWKHRPTVLPAILIALATSIVFSVGAVVLLGTIADTPPETGTASGALSLAGTATIFAVPVAVALHLLTRARLLALHGITNMAIPASRFGAFRFCLQTVLAGVLRAVPLGALIGLPIVLSIQFIFRQFSFGSAGSGSLLSESLYSLVIVLPYLAAAACLWLVPTYAAFASRLGASLVAILALLALPIALAALLEPSLDVLPDLGADLPVSPIPLATTTFAATIILCLHRLTRLELGRQQRPDPTS